MWYTIENVYMLEAAVIGTGGFLLSLEGSKVPIKGSFIKTVISRAIASAILVAIAVLTPVLLYTIPTFFHFSPIIAEENVRTMISILLTFAGLIVAITMCIPFTKWRVFVMVFVFLTVFALSMLLPTSYICGRPTSANMFAYDSSMGQTFMDSQFMRELFRPWNSEGVKAFAADNANFIVIGIFFFVMLPLFFGTMTIVNKYILGNNNETKDRFINNPKQKVE